MSGPIRHIYHIRASGRGHYPSCRKPHPLSIASDLFLSMCLCECVWNVCGSVIASNLSKLRGEYDSAITNLISVDEQFVLTNGQVRSKF